MRGIKGYTKVFCKNNKKSRIASMAELFFTYAIRSLALNTELYFHTKFLQMTLPLKRSPVYSDRPTMIVTFSQPIFLCSFGTRSPAIWDQIFPVISALFSPCLYPSLGLPLLLRLLLFLCLVLCTHCSN